MVTKEKTVKVVGVEKIQYKIGTGDFADVPDPLVVAKDTVVTFKAISKPADSFSNIKDKLQEILPGYNFVYRYGWDTYRRNVDIYGNPLNQKLIQGI